MKVEDLPKFKGVANDEGLVIVEHAVMIVKGPALVNHLAVVEALVTNKDQVPLRVTSESESWCRLYPS